MTRAQLFNLDILQLKEVLNSIETENFDYETDEGLIETIRRWRERNKNSFLSIRITDNLKLIGHNGSWRDSDSYQRLLAIALSLNELGCF